MSESLKKRIEKLNRKLDPVREERDKLNSEARKWADRRNSTHEQMKMLRTEAANLKEKRDTLNTQVRELKNLREKANSQRNEIRAQILKIKEKIMALLGKKPPRTMHDLQSEMEKIEWKIQTTPLLLKEEKLLVDQVKALEGQLTVYRQIQKLKESIVELETREKELEAEAKLYHEKLSELAEQSQKSHEERLKVLDKAHSLQTEADSAHQKFLEFKQQAQGFHEKYMELYGQVKSLREELSRTEEERQAKRQLELRKEVKEKAREKLKQGEKLTWEEFKLLAERGTLKKSRKENKSGEH